MTGRLEAYLTLAESCVPHLLRLLRAVAPSIGTRKEAVALASAYSQIPPINLSRALLSRCPGSLFAIAARDVGWSDWGEASRIVHTLRRYNPRPDWLRTYARAGVQIPTGA